MNRRGMLKGLGAAAAAGLWPGWLSEAFAGQPCGVLRGTATLGAAIQRAHQALKPLLVLVIPAEEGAKWERGRHFGEWLNFGSDRDLAPLACAELVCSEMAAVRQLFPSAPAGAEPAALIAQVDRAPARLGVALDAFNAHPDALRVMAPLAEEAGAREWLEFRAKLKEQEGANVETCIDRTGAAIRDAILGDAGALQRRADERWERLAAGDREVTRRILGGGDGAPRDVVAVAPLLAAAAAQRGGAEEQRLTRLLAEAARVQYCTQRIPGSKWAQSSGCGEIVEGEESRGIGILCGMGHVPDKSRRFLYFFVRSPYGG